MPALTWPEPLPQSGPIRLRPFRADDLGLVAELADDPYVPLIGTVPAAFTEADGLAYLERQHQRLADGAGWSIAIAELGSDRAVGGAGRWLHAEDPATAGYVVASARADGGRPPLHSPRSPPSRPAGTNVNVSSGRDTQVATHISREELT